MDDNTTEQKTDKFHGQGGSYVIDPATQERVLVERTKETAEAEEVVPPSDAGDAAGKSASKRTRV